ncbi:MAG: PrsW family intramembrane metalloprotease [Desulfomonile tiedjei]|uniref:PrsW family intramembrane metalloprotease n=1 Tax=Desulfomonile tiedjei TaxID=2358 RepID=A0A9D6V9T8_9BACT|nr:PrsW family intramembrane metalloprotease [Desulfomonile tiedjei]
MLSLALCLGFFPLYLVFSYTSKAAGKTWLSVSSVLYGRATKVNRGESLELPYAFLGLIPGAAWLLYFHWTKGRHQRSFTNVLRVFLWGCFCTLPAGIIEHVTGAGLRQDTVLSSAAVGFLLIGPIEELSKLVAVWGSIYRSPDFRDPMHGILYSATAACAFASIENVVYMTQLGPGILVLRLAFATPAHVMFSSMWGYSMGVARFQKTGEIATIAKGLLAAVVLHGVYNCIVAINPKMAVVTLIPLMIFMGWIMLRMIARFRKNYPFPSLGRGVMILCPNCGAYALESVKHCSRCGFAIPTAEPDAPRFCANCRARLEPSKENCASCGENVQISGQCRAKD